MKVKLILLMFSFIVTSLFADVSLNGVVKDDSGSPLEGISVYLKSSSDKSLADVTNAQGEYAIVETDIVSPVTVQQQAYVLYKNRLTATFTEKTVLNISLYSLQGKYVASLVDQEFKAGYTSLLLQTEGIANGVYVLAVEENGKIRSFKQSLLDSELSGISSFVEATKNSRAARRAPVDTLVFEGEGYTTVEVPIESYSLTHNQILQKKEGELPDTFTKKVAFEELTGLWCGYCPYGAKKIKDKVAELGNRFIAVAIHVGDVLEIPDGKSLSQRYGGSGYPSCVVDRGTPVHPSSSDGDINASLAKKANCGIKIDATEDGKVTVSAGFLTTLSEDVRLTVYLLENKIPNTGDYKQKDYNNILWSGYTNDHSLVKVLSDNYLGDPVNHDAGTIESKTFTYDLSGTVNSNKENCTIVALLNVVGSSASEDEVLNIQEVHLGELKNFD